MEILVVVIGSFTSLKSTKQEFLKYQINVDNIYWYQMHILSALQLHSSATSGTTKN